MPRFAVLLLLVGGCGVEGADSDRTEEEDATTEQTNVAVEGGAGWPTGYEYSSICFHDDTGGCKSTNDEPQGDYRIKCPENYSTGWYECITDELSALGVEGWRLMLYDDRFPVDEEVYLLERAVFD